VLNAYIAGEVYAIERGLSLGGFRKGSSSVDIAVIVSICLCLFRWNSW
jgi:hypothetical protein